MSASTTVEITRVVSELTVTSGVAVRDRGNQHQAMGERAERIASRFTLNMALYLTFEVTSLPFALDAREPGAHTPVHHQGCPTIRAERAKPNPLNLIRLEPAEGA